MTNLVNLSQDNQATTTSKCIADKFEKEHRHVMESVRKLLKAMSKEFGESNFRLSSYISEQNKQLPCYELTRDGFMMVAMGFVGDKAVQWKESYISAFNKMEQYLTTNTQLSLTEAERTAEDTALLNAKADKAEAEQRLYAVQQKGAYDAVEQTLRMAQLFNAPMDINDLIRKDLASIPAPIITELKMKLAPKIHQFGTLDTERSSLGSLLEKHEFDMTPVKFNEAYLVPLGMLSSDRKVIGSGLYFGTNDKASSTKGITQPRWFDNRFAELLEFVKTQTELVA